jgi:multiple sugar transport system permease protein
LPKLSRNPWWRRAYRERWAYLFLAAPLLLFAVFRLVPILITLALGFMDYVPGGAAAWVGGENYAYVWRDDLFWKALRNTFLYTLGVVPLGLAVALLLSWLIFRLKSGTWQVIFKSAFYLPGVASGAILALVWLWMFNPAYGLLNWLCSLVGLGPFRWTGDARSALPSLVLMALAGGHGAAVVLLTAAMGSIPETYYEAARLDGAKAWAEFRSITLPLLRPTLLYLVVTSTIASFQVFTQVLLMTGGGPYYATTTWVHLIYTDAFEFFDFGKAAAEATLLFVGLALVAVVQYRFLSTDVEY